MTTNAEFALLKSLEEVGEYAIPKKTLFADVNVRLSANRVMTHSDYDSLLDRLQEKGRVRVVTGEDDCTVLITENGKHRLAQLKGR